ncbi:MAG: hypothetical protein P1V97_33430, partial [Planctomycetota bacterium]|nr:hypothetical protein [Planctomycetota bacterium]
QKQSVLQCQGQPESFLTLAAVHGKLGDALSETSGVRGSSMHLNRAESIQAMLIKATKGDKTSYEFNYSVTLASQFSLYAKLKDLKKAQSYLEKFRSYAKRKNYQNIDPRSLILFGGNYHRMGTLFLENRNLKSAFFWFEKSVIVRSRMSPELANRDKSYPGYLGVLGCRLGKNFFDAMDFETSQRCYLISEKIYEELLLRRPENISFMNNRLVSCHHLGLIAEKTGDRAKALSYFQKELRIALDVQKLSAIPRVADIIKRAELKIQELGQ